MNDRVLVTFTIALSVVCVSGLAGAVVLVVNGHDIPPSLMGVSGTALGMLVMVINYHKEELERKKHGQQYRTQPSGQGGPGKTKPSAPDGSGNPVTDRQTPLSGNAG